LSVLHSQKRNRLKRSPKTKTPKQRTRAISETLLEAEEDHLLGCPNADFNSRAAAFILDAILFFLISSGVTHLCNALNVHLSHLGSNMLAIKGSDWRWFLFQASRHSAEITAYLSLMLKLALFYFYFVWSIAYAGGTPGKLLLGLRVVNIYTGQAIGFPQALLREILGKSVSFLLLGYGFLIAWFRPDRLALHDVWTDSVVKKVHGAR
jgi:uncharacterized RDD family membrane protein YckC